jgi:hypothetical protein
MERIANRAALAAICALLGVLTLGTSGAQAFTNNYCGALIAEGTWCGDGSNHSYNYNQATYTGAGNVWVCERLLIADTTTQREAPQCGFNYIDRTFSSGYPYLTEAEVTHNTGTGANHTIYGYATA